MKKASVKKAKKIIEKRIDDVQAFNEQNKQDPNLKIFKNLVFREEDWTGW